MDPPELDFLEAEPESKPPPAVLLEATSVLQEASELQEPLEPSEPLEPPLMELLEQPLMVLPELDCQEAEPEPLEPMEPPAAHHTPAEVEPSEDQEPIREVDHTTSETTD